jgi:multicomponent Na+:H+ antiporter subunit E
MTVAKRLVPAIAWLLIVWLGLWESISPGTLVGGLITAVVLLWLFPLRHRAPVTWRLRPLAAARFAGYFVWKLIEASLVVAWEVATPQNSINEGIVAIPIRGVSEGLITLVANAISLTPGTVTIDVDEDPAVLYVHVLHLHDIEAVRREVQYLELLAIRALGSDEAAEAIARDHARPAGEGSLSQASEALIEPDPSEEER